MSTPRIQLDLVNVLESIPKAVLVTDQENRIHHCNNLALTLFGYSAEELLGQPLNSLVPVSLHKIELNARKKTGEEILVEISSLPLQGIDQQLSISVVKDVTERKKFEQALLEKKTSNLKKLCMRLNSMHKSSRETEEKLIETERKSAAMHLEQAKLNLRKHSDFLAHLCHELRNPLAGTRGSLNNIQQDIIIRQDLLEKMLTKCGIGLKSVEEIITCIDNAQAILDTSESLNQLCNKIPNPLTGIHASLQNIQEYIISIQSMLEKMLIECRASFESVEDIDICAAQSQSILDANLDLSRISQTDFKLYKTSFDFKIAMLEVYRIMKGRAKAKGLEFTLVLPDEALTVLGDVVRNKQIAINLVSNAIKYTNKGSIEFKVNILQHLSSSRQIEIQVKDTGIGLDENENSNT